MAPDASHEIDLKSYSFEDSQEYIIVNLYATGNIEQKDIDVLIELDSLEVITPGIRLIPGGNKNRINIIFFSIYSWREMVI